MIVLPKIELHVTIKDIKEVDISMQEFQDFKVMIFMKCSCGSYPAILRNVVE